MPYLPVIVVISLATAIIIAVLLWRVRPTSAADADALSQRVSEEAQKATAIQAKFEASQEALREAAVASATAKEAAAAAAARADAADQRTDQLKSQVDGLQQKCNEADPRIATAIANREAAEAARAELELRYDALTQKYDALQADHNNAVERAAASKTEVEQLHTQIGGLARTLESYELNLTEEKAKLNQALAKQQSDESAAHQIENITQQLLKRMLEEAKHEVGELAAAFQKSSDGELHRHADAVAQTLAPLQNKLQAYSEAIESMKKEAHETYGGLRHQITELHNAERSLHEQAKALTTALSASPKVKGNYGELILKQLVEFVGMQEKCHFETQAFRDTEEGRKIPDLVVSLPGGQKVLVDAKAVMDACVEAQMAQDDGHRSLMLKRHCDNVRSRVVDLSSKNYFANHQDSVEVVVLFLPAENLYATAMENDPGLTEFAMSKNIIVCGPNSLMLLLKVSSQLWRRSAIEEEAQKIKECGDGIYKSACDFVEKFAKIGTKIRLLEDQYNDAAGTLDGRLIPKGREMSRLTAMTNNRTMEDTPKLRDDIHQWRSSEAKKQLVAPTEKLPGLLAGDETPEFSFAIGEAQ